jgi:SMC interacting uncharacterized protein involved in chromosome segregation
MPDGRTVGNRNTIPCDPDFAWVDWQDSRTLEAAIREGIGDTSFFEAESLCPQHSEAVKQLQAEIAAKRARYKKLQEAQKSLEAFIRTENRRFEEFHGHKYGHKYYWAYFKAQKRLKPEYDRLVAAVEEARKNLQNEGAKCTAAVDGLSSLCGSM